MKMKISKPDLSRGGVLKALKWCAIGLFWFIVAGVVAVMLLVVRYGGDLPDYKKLAVYAPAIATRLYAADGRRLIEYADEHRVMIDYADMPPQLVNAFVAAEDQNFWHHPGIDIFGITRALGNNVIHMLGGSARFTGASTITQQVAKNFFLNSDRTMSRKIKEMILALKLERAFSKEHIMTLYLNQIFLGARAYGVGSASQIYFNKSVKDLTLGQMAFLASLPKAPNNAARTTERRDYVLRRMRQEGYITAAQQTAALNEPLEFSTGFMDEHADEYQYFAEAVRQELMETMTRDQLYSEGMYVKTTIIPEIQDAVSKSLNDTLDAYNNARPNSRDKLQGAVIVIEPHTGRIVAMSGGRSFAESPFNRATQGLRQIGSTIKPFMYLAALERGWSPTTILLDAPIVGWSEGSTLWKPENYDKKFLGEIPMRIALEQSRNVPTVRMVQDIGVPNALEMAQRFGVYDDKVNNTSLSMALGAGETTLEKLTLGFAAFVNGGRRIEPKMIDYVMDRYGNVVGEQSQPGAYGIRPDNVGAYGIRPDHQEWSPNLMPPTPPADATPLVDAQSLYQLIWMLQGVVENGTGKQARVAGHTIAGKTGTTNDVKDIWFVGVSKNLVAGVWMGYDTPSPIGGGGSYMSAKVFGDFMTVALAGEKNQPFAVPNGISFIRVNKNTGVSATIDPNGPIISEAFKAGQSPNEPRAATGTGAGNVVVGGVF